MERITRRRAGLIAFLVLLTIGFFCLRLHGMQIVDSENKQNNITTYETRTRIRATRGDLLDTKGNVLVASRNVDTRAQAVPATALGQLGGQYFAVSDLNGFFASAHYTAASSIMVEGDICVGYVVVASPADNCR